MPLSHPAALIATGFGLGLLPWMPGTWASLAVLPCAWFLDIGAGAVAVGTAAVIAFAAGWWASAAIVRTTKSADPGFVVIDEIAAQMCVLAAMPRDWRFYAIAFLLFRLFDIWKPFPIGWIDRTAKGGLGVMLDDAAAAIYALALILIAAGVLGVRP